jgi:octaprenyl-diphosphate synthase
MLQQIITTFRPYLDQVDRYIEGKLSTDIPLLDSVERHVMASNGKRIRPVLHLLSCLVCGEVTQANIIVAAISEFIHTATLLHDDVIDNSTTRRGKPTVNNLWGNELSVMVGDYFYTLSINSLIEAGNIEVLRIFSGATQAMTEGEIIQRENMGNTQLAFDEYLDIIRRKTAVLFSACCRSAAVIAGYDQDEANRWGTFGENLGIAFQLIDDLLDYTGSQVSTGKQQFTDLNECKLTMPLLHAIARANSEEVAEIRTILQNPVKSDADMAAVLRYVSRSGGIDATRELAATYCRNAVANLVTFSESPHYQLIGILANYILQRSR